MKIKPLNDRVLLSPVEKWNVTESGIYLPESSNKEKPYIYKVISVWDSPKINVKSGDKILCGQYAGDDLKIEGKDMKIIWVDYILAIVE